MLEICANLTPFKIFLGQRQKSKEIRKDFEQKENEKTTNQNT